MAFRAAYGPRDSIRSAVLAGIIPKESIVFSKEDTMFAEAFLVTPDGSIKEVTYKNKFNSMDEALAWIEKYDCTGNIISIRDNADGIDEIAAYVVQANKTLNRVSGQECIVEYATVLEFPTIGKPHRLYIALNENGGKGAIYRWDSGDQKYYKPIDDSGGLPEEGSVLVGGGAAV